MPYPIRAPNIPTIIDINFKVLMKYSAATITSARIKARITEYQLFKKTYASKGNPSNAEIRKSQNNIINPPRELSLPFLLLLKKGGIGYFTFLLPALQKIC